MQNTCLTRISSTYTREMFGSCRLLKTKWAAVGHVGGGSSARGRLQQSIWCVGLACQESRRQDFCWLRVREWVHEVFVKCVKKRMKPSISHHMWCCSDTWVLSTIWQISAVVFTELIHRRISLITKTGSMRRPLCLLPPHRQSGK